MKFCFLCGKKTEELVKGYCEECYKKKFNLLEVPEEIVITTCHRCNKKFDKNKWKETDVEDIVRDCVKVVGNNVRIMIDVDQNIKLTAKGYLEGSREEKEEAHEIRMRIIKKVCPVCTKESGKYFEATVQVRGNMTKEDFDAMDEIAYKRNGFFRVKEVKGGHDFLVGSKSLAKKMAEYIVKKYKIDKTKSFHLVTKKDGRDLYRDTVLLRIS